MREIRLNAGIDHGAKAKRGRHENYRQTWKRHGAEVKPVTIRNHYQTREKKCNRYNMREDTLTIIKGGKKLPLVPSEGKKYVI